MGRLIYGLSVSLDGFVETPSRSLDWVRVDEELHSFFNEQGRELGASIYGRRMYELMAGYWPTADRDPSATPAELEWARIWRDLTKIVFSRTLDEVSWNSRLVRGDPVEEVTRLKAESDFDMDVAGPTLAAPLIRAGLVDEFRLFVQPVVLGEGTRFFPDMANRIDVELLETRTFGSGVVYLRYGAAAGP
jgi:dihydrofolate reductase